MEIIRSKENKRIKNLRLLIEKHSERKKKALYVVEGLKMVNEALSLGLTREIFVSETFYKALEDEKGGSLKEESRKFQTYLSKISEFFVVSDSIYKSLSETVSPQGILASVAMPMFTEELLKEKERIRLLVLENISDPGNLGTMIRTAEAAGMTAVIMSKNTVDIYNPKVVRSTMGSIFRLPFFYVEDLSEFIKSMKEDEVLFYAAHLKGELDYKSVHYARKAAVVIGNEAKGLSDEVSELCDVYVRIRMEGKVESLNAAIAAALMMYELNQKAPSIR